MRTTDVKICVRQYLTERAAEVLEKIRETMAGEYLYSEMTGAFMIRVDEGHGLCFWVERKEDMASLAERQGWVIPEMEMVGVSGGWTGWCLGCSFTQWHGCDGLTADNLEEGEIRDFIQQMLRYKTSQRKDVFPRKADVFRYRRKAGYGYAAVMTRCLGKNGEGSNGDVAGFLSRCQGDEGLFQSVLWHGLTASDTFLGILAGGALFGSVPDAGGGGKTWIDREVEMLARRSDGVFMGWDFLSTAALEGEDVVLAGTWAISEEEMERISEGLMERGAGKVWFLFYGMDRKHGLSGQVQYRLKDWYIQLQEWRAGQ